ncbi:MAG: bifunctional DNA-formamidopyrimidine glycosylase/DNA-(apurinic or apyrimidinic site) lyase [Chloroflexota bacterium]|nr:bifunctional DNA-formamidopyrimidine glycosylase/DNA-(apurinic or apyrimidinic site) lyase [Chloroflexota bacterium]
MPELPEVQTTVDELRPQLLGRTFIDLRADWPPTLATAPPSQFRARLVGQRILKTRRRGKYLVFPLSGGDTLLIHLMMSGQLSVVPSSNPCDRHTHTRFLMDDGRELRFRDVRKLGRAYLVADPEEVVGHLGPEPLAEEFTLPQFRRLIARRRGRLKPLLLNQQFLAGLGNIYADETLFAARLHPLRTADTLTEQEIERLYHSIRAVLTRALAHQGTTLDDSAYRRPDGQAGNYQERLQVYGREGEPCFLCGTSIQRIAVSERGTYFCPQCQRRFLTSTS